MSTKPARLRARMTPGEMLRTVRGLQEMTQAELALASGVSQPAISAIEAGRTELGPDRARKLAVALRVHPAVLLFPDWEEPAMAHGKATRRTSDVVVKGATRRKAEG
jgi:transcriptional regulator with XRE-family HTH domain